ncbi:hypothetical protein [Alkaliphilus transvaalensis]|nr:hypothetical protein [Alkaliphilus transvaalensis]
MKKENIEKKLSSQSQENKQTQQELEKAYQILLENRQKKIQLWK